MTVIDGPGVGSKLLVDARPTPPDGTLGHPELDRIALRDALAELEAGRSGVRHYGPEGQTTPEDLVDTPIVRVFIESWAPPPQMWIFGAVDFTAALGKVAKVLGYRVTVCDAREVFATRRRFPMADEVVVSWPTPLFERRGNTLTGRDAVCILTHDPKFDVPAVQGALATGVGYIGVMGSRKTHAKRMERLAEVGVDRPEQLGPADVADRARPRCAHTRRDGDLDLCRDHRPPHRAASRRHCATAQARSTPERAARRHSGDRVGELDRPLAVLGQQRERDALTTLRRVQDRIADAEIEHHVTGVPDDVAGLRRWPCRRWAGSGSACG